jgi:hypothetical protein
MFSVEAGIVCRDATGRIEAELSSVFGVVCDNVLNDLECESVGKAFDLSSAHGVGCARCVRRADGDGMSDAIVFVLHAPADEAAAIELASALAPLRAQAVRLGEPASAAVRFGAGARCVLLWSAHASQLDASVLGAALGHDAATFILCRGAINSTEFTARGFQVVEGSGDAAADAAKLQTVIADSTRGELSAGKMRSVPHAAVTAETPVVKNRTLAVRSAVGLAATVAVAGVIAPVIGQRASATAGSDTDATFEYGFTPVEPLGDITPVRLAAVQPARMTTMAFAAAQENSPTPLPETNDMQAKAAPESLERGGAVAADESKGAKGLRPGEEYAL